MIRYILRIAKHLVFQASTFERRVIPDQRNGEIQVKTPTTDFVRNEWVFR